MTELMPIAGLWGGNKMSVTDMGSGKNDTPQPPSLSDVIGQYNQTLPSVYQTNNSLLNQYYPSLAGLPNQMAQQASQGSQEGVPQWMRNEYQSDLSARLGTNVASPIGADYMSRGLLNQAQQWRQYYQNMGVNLSSQIPALQNAMTGGYTPSQALSYTSGTYGSYLPQYTAASQYNPTMSALAGIAGTAAGAYFGGGTGAALGSQLGSSLGSSSNSLNSSGNLPSFNSNDFLNYYNTRY